MIAAGIAVLTGLGADINKTLLLGSALAEATAIYGFVVALLLVIMK